MDENQLAGWVKQLASGKRFAQASCDFAGLVWSGEISQQQQIELLQSSEANVHCAVAWAVADLERDSEAMRYLIAKCSMTACECTHGGPFAVSRF